MQLNEKMEDLTDSLKEYANTNYELIKLEVIENSSVISAGIISTLIVGVMLVFFTFFISLYVAYYLSDQIEGNYIGFVIVGAFYMLLSIIIFTNKNKLIEQPIRNSIIRRNVTNNKQPQDSVSL